MNRKWFASLLVLLVILSAAFVWVFLQNRVEVKAGSGDVMSGVIAEKRDANTIIVGLDPHYPPMEFFDGNNQIIGFDIDLIKATMNKLGKPYELKPIAWNDKTKLLNNNTIDIIWSGLNITDERKGLYELSNSYLPSEQVVTVAASSNITSLAQLADKRIGVESGTFMLPEIEKFGETNPAGHVSSVDEYSESAVATVKILSGEIDAVISDAVNAKYYASRSDGRFRVLPTPLWKGEGVAVGARKGDTKMISEINIALDELRKNGVYQSIYEKWFGR